MLTVQRVPVRDSADHHIAVADRLDFLDAVLFDQFVEFLEENVEHVDGGMRTKLCRKFGETDDVGEKHRNLRENFRDRLLSATQSFGDRGRKNIVEQLFRTGAFDLEVRQGFARKLYLVFELVERDVQICSHRIDGGGEFADLVASEDRGLSRQISRANLANDRHEVRRSNREAVAQKDQGQNNHAK